MAPRKKSGFTLLELSVVLVIIGLIAGAILGGQEMVRSAAIRSTLTDMDKYKTAIGAFRDKYAALPGDMTNATQYWGSAGGTGSDATCYAIDQTRITATCNGDGDGQIGVPPVTAGPTAHYEETYLFWKHLSDASLVTGAFSGSTGGAGVNNNLPGTNTPLTRLSASGIEMEYIGSRSGQSGWYDGKYGHVFLLDITHTGPLAFSPIFTVSEMQSIDSKTDDGRPGTGKIRSFAPATTSCADTANPDTALYNGAASGIACALIQMTGY